MRSKERRRPRLPWIKNRRRAINAAQNALIILLVISSVLLAGGRAGFSLRENISGYGAFSRSDGAQQGPQYGAAAEPMSIVVTPEDGIHDAAMYDSRALDEAYSRYSAALAEALGSAGEPEEVGENEWVSALHGPGVYFDYYTDCQLSSLAIWLGSEMNGGAAGHTARQALPFAGGRGGHPLLLPRARRERGLPLLDRPLSDGADGADNGERAGREPLRV